MRCVLDVDLYLVYDIEIDDVLICAFVATRGSMSGSVCVFRALLDSAAVKAHIYPFHSDSL